VTTKFALYIDESGSPKPSRKDKTRYFAIGGVLVKKEDEADICQKVRGFKEHWRISENIPLHGNEIRSRKGNFAWVGLLSEDEQNRFFQDLTDLIICCPVVIHGCIISRDGYLDRYLNRYSSNTWEMMKSAFWILLERVSKFVNCHKGEVIVYFEKVGKKEDRLIHSYFNQIRNHGLPFDPQTSEKYAPLSQQQLQYILTGIEGKSKNNPIVQVADLCLYPIAKAKEQAANKAFQALIHHKKLIDTLLDVEDLETMGIKYYCYDKP
jgi:hypothetical protein